MTLREHVAWEPAESRQVLFDPPTWLYGAQPIVAGLALLAAAVALTGLCGAPLGVMTLVAVVVALRPANRLWSWLRRLDKKREDGRARQELPSTHRGRITIRGPTAQIVEIAGTPCAPFPPVIARTSQRVFHSERLRHELGMADWIIVGALGLTIALSIILRLPTSALLACLWTAGGVEYFLRRLPGPYLKVEPGLLEVLTGKWVSAAWRVRETVKLADATVTADLHRGVLEIAQGGIHYAVDLWAVEHPVEVVTRACVAATLPRVDAAEAESRDRPDTT